MPQLNYLPMHEYSKWLNSVYFIYGHRYKNVIVICTRRRLKHFQTNDVIIVYMYLSSILKGVCTAD